MYRSRCDKMSPDSMRRNCTPREASPVAALRPAGPAPMTSTSTDSSIWTSQRIQSAKREEGT